jgi:hypothetical protein
MLHNFKELPQRKVIEQSTLMDCNPPMLYRLCHHYSDDELFFYLPSQEIDPADLCAYIQFKSETEIELELELVFQHVLEFLYLTLGALQVINVSSNNSEYIDIDLYNERDMRCGEWFNTNQSYFDSVYGDYAESLLKNTVKCSQCDLSAIRVVDGKPLCDGHN